MKNIDFLPNAYRERNALRNARAWWGVVVLIFGTVLLATASVQFTWRRGVQAELDEIEPQYLAAKQRDLELARLQKQIQAASEAAGLYTYLQHPWPRTQILASIAGPLPPTIHLHEIHLGEETLPIIATETASGKRRTAAKDKDAPKLPPGQQDLAALRQDCDRKQTVVELRGAAENAQQLHAYVSELGKSPIVAAAQLKSLESVSQSERDALPEGAGHRLAGTRFNVRLVIRPGYGQPGGPEPKAAAKRSATAGQMPARPLAGGP